MGVETVDLVSLDPSSFHFPDFRQTSSIDDDFLWITTAFEVTILCVFLTLPLFLCSYPLPCMLCDCLNPLDHELRGIIDGETGKSVSQSKRVNLFCQYAPTIVITGLQSLLL